MNCPKMPASYHNHTLWSDGKATLAEMIDGARRAGLSEFGVSDHFSLVPGGRRFPWAMEPEFLGEYVAQVQLAQATTKKLAIRLGLEVDYFPETIELARHQLSPYSFDYLIGSVHVVDGFPIDMDSQLWEELLPEARNRIWCRYWQRLREAAETGLFDIIAHFDLPKKFRYYPSVDLTEAALAALDAIAAADMALEINSAGWDTPVQEAYPSLFYLQEAKLRKIPLIISSDAHASGHVARHFDRAHLLAVAAGYTEVVRFEHQARFLNRL